MLIKILDKIDYYVVSMTYSDSILNTLQLIILTLKNLSGQGRQGTCYE